MFQRLNQLLSHFSRDTKGVAAILFALALVPLIGAGGAAIDYSRAFIVQSRLASALDASALAMGASNIQDEKKLKELGERYFKANYPAEKLGVPGSIQISVTDKAITVSGNAQLPTSLMGVIGIDNLKVKAVAEVTRALSALEVVMVLDNTGSMYGSKLSTLKQASNDLIDELFGGDNNNTLVKMGVVPFAGSVNVGKKSIKAGWIDVQAKSPQAGINFNNGKNKKNKKANVMSLYKQFKNTQWGGCVETRSYPLDVTDVPPDVQKPETLWVPYFYPDEPDHHYYTNNYLKDGVNGTMEERQKDVSKYQNAQPGRNKEGSSAGPNFNCEISAVIPLTAKKYQVKKAIKKMVARGSTSIPIGMVWGWRVISPEKPYTQGADYNDQRNPTTKAIVLMTDGDNTFSLGDERRTHNKSRYNGYGYVAEQIETKRLNTTDTRRARDRMDDRLAEVCENVKKKGIIVFSVAFKIRNNNTKTLIRECASGVDRYYDASNSEKLKQAFKTIGRDLSELRLSK